MQDKPNIGKTHEIAEMSVVASKYARIEMLYLDYEHSRLYVNLAELLRLE